MDNKMSLLPAFAGQKLKKRTNQVQGTPGEFTHFFDLI
jgi:hypothetical protein